VNELLVQRLEREAEKITLDMPASLTDKEFTAVFNVELVRLVLHECINIVDMLPNGYKDYRNTIENEFREDCINTMKKHFGVEE
jgi:hypothetical protein